VTDFSTQTCRHFAGRVYAWIVVNEAIEPPDGRSDGLRNSLFMKKIGPEYIDMTFRAAREGDPKAKLVYNDYDLELDIDFHDARPRAVTMRRGDSKRHGAAVDVIGSQRHLRASLSPRHFNETLFSKFLDEQSLVEMSRKQRRPQVTLDADDVDRGSALLAVVEQRHQRPATSVVEIDVELEIVVVVDQLRFRIAFARGAERHVDVFRTNLFHEQA